MPEIKGILLAGGSGTRLYPATFGVSKQLLPVYDKPMIYYPLSLLMQAGIRDIAIITTPQDMPAFQRTLGSGDQWGIGLTFLEQSHPRGIAEAYLLAEDFLDRSRSVMVLGDNIFLGGRVAQTVARRAADPCRATVFASKSATPEAFGVLGFDAAGQPNCIVEKPRLPPSDLVTTGLYILDGTASDRARSLRPSSRGELEITCLLRSYLEEAQLRVERLGPDTHWLDSGTHESLFSAADLVRRLQQRSGQAIGNPDIVAYENGWIGEDALRTGMARTAKSSYGEVMSRTVEKFRLAEADRTPGLRACG